jgi:hypothetical protein
MMMQMVEAFRRELQKAESEKAIFCERVVTSTRIGSFHTHADLLGHQEFCEAILFVTRTLRSTPRKTSAISLQTASVTKYAP